MSSFNILIGGDTFLGRGIELTAINSPTDLIEDKIKEIFHRAHFNILNLESPLTNCDDSFKIMKTGPNLKADPRCVQVLNYLNIDLVTLANNHIFDYGSKGLDDTLKICQQNLIKYIGAGSNIDDAAKYLIHEVEGIKYSFLNFTENEWCNASEDNGGANPMDIINNSRQIKDAKLKSDVIIVIIHGGHEKYYYPSPRMVDQYRFYAEQGASIIVNHHSHCVSGYEIYKNVPIFYGLGNFIFDSQTKFDGWFQGQLLSLTIDSKKNIFFELIPYTQLRGKKSVQLLKGEIKKEFFSKLENINAIIANPLKLKEKFDEYSDEQYKYRISAFSNSYIIKSSFIRKLIRRLNLEKYFLRKDQLKIITNYIRCESHKDIALKILNKYFTK